MKYKVTIRIEELNIKIKFPCLMRVIMKCINQSNMSMEYLTETSKQQKQKQNLYQFHQNLQAIANFQRIKQFRLQIVLYSTRNQKDAVAGIISIKDEQLESGIPNTFNKQLQFSSTGGTLKYTILKFSQFVQEVKEAQFVQAKQKNKKNIIDLGPICIPGVFSYQNLPQWTQQDIQNKRKQNNTVILLYEDLIIDASKFQHPGSNKLLKEINQNQIQQLFDKTQHSLIAKIFLCQMTIGRLKDSQIRNNGKKIIQQVINNKDYQFHLQTIKKIDFTKSIDDQLAVLTPQEKTIIADFPKIVDKPANIRIFDDEELLYPNSKISQARFWVSTPIFFLNSLIFFGYAWLNITNTNLIGNILTFLLGILVWTLIQYCFHRFLLHKGFNSNFKNEEKMHPHEIHHAFPNKRAILSLSPMKNYPKIFGIFLFVYIIFGLNFTLNFMSGLLFGMAAYDSVHYFVHFGPDTNIQPFASLRTHHLKHHYRNRDRGFGVSTTLWDYVFRTGYK